MTYEEAIIEISNYMMDEYGCGTLSNKTLRLAVEALKKAEKYRCHDLRKNPYDLPKHKNEVLLKTDPIVGKPHHELGWFIEEEHVFSCDSGYFEIDDIATWREIEPFEEDEE